MRTNEILYDYNSIVIVGVLFIVMLFINESGFQLGRFVQKNTDDEVKTLTGAVQGSILGLLALLLGFTFSMSMQRYDARNHALITEANMISHVMLRVQMLPEAPAESIRKNLAAYVKARIEVGQVDLTQRLVRGEYAKRLEVLQQALWTDAMAVAEIDARPLTTGAFITSLAQMFEAQDKRNALLQMHVPEPVLLLLFVVFLTAGGILGYSSGLSSRRILSPTVLIALLIVLIVFLIIDLDRPKRGLIQINQSILTDLAPET